MRQGEQHHVHGVRGKPEPVEIVGIHDLERVDRLHQVLDLFHELAARRDHLLRIRDAGPTETVARARLGRERDARERKRGDRQATH